MARYEITSPDGSRYEISAPDDASESQVLQFARQQFETMQAKGREREQKGVQAAADERARFDEAEKARPWYQRAAINLGAGIDTTYQGAKQLLGGGMDDEALEEKRAIDERAAELIPGGGALQIAGEVAPTLAIPGGAAVRGAHAAGRGLGLSRAAAATGKLTGRQAMADAAVMGAAMGALQPVLSDESRLANAAIGAAGGAALPAAFAGGKGLYRTMTRRGAAGRAAEQLSEQATGGASRAVAQAVDEIPLSTAASTGDLGLAVAERASRVRNPAAWRALDEDTAKGVWETLERGTANAANLAEHRAARQSDWFTNTTRARDAVDPAMWSNEMVGFQARLAEAARSPAGQNEMRGVVKEIERQLADLGSEFGPEHLMRLRARMAGQVKGSPDDPFRAAPKTDPYFISLRDEMDRILDDVTSGQWSPVNESYAAGSKPVTASKASQAVRDTFLTPEGIARAGEIGNVPKVTEHTLRRTMARLGENKFGDALAPETRNRLTHALDALRRQNITQDVKSAGTGGGGSNTAMDITASGAESALMPTRGVLAAVYRTVTGIGDQLLKQEMDRLLQNPQAYIAAMQRLEAANQPLSRSQRALMKMLSQGGAGAAVGLLSAPSGQ